MTFPNIENPYGNETSKEVENGFTKETYLLKDIRRIFKNALGDGWILFFDENFNLKESIPTNAEKIRKIIDQSSDADKSMPIGVACSFEKNSMKELSGRCEVDINPENRSNPLVHRTRIKDYYASGLDLVIEQVIITSELNKMALLGSCDYLFGKPQYYKAIGPNLYKFLKSLIMNYFGRVYHNNQVREFSPVEEEFEEWFLESLDKYVGVLRLKDLLHIELAQEDMNDFNSVLNDTSYDTSNLNGLDIAPKIIKESMFKYLTPMLAAMLIGETDEFDNNLLDVSYKDLDDKDRGVFINSLDGTIANQSLLPEELQGKITTVYELLIYLKGMPIKRFITTLVYACNEEDMATYDLSFDDVDHNFAERIREINSRIDPPKNKNKAFDN